ncbi:MAG: trypsin-like serine protease [Archangium sp.]|nr:trypsin-like serine protease [Archangium sp.]
MREHTLIGGTPAPNASAVFLLDIRGDNGVTSSCTATLIGSRTLLTAAHCIDPVVLGATTNTIIATNAPTPQDVVPGVNTWTAVERKLHPEWRPQFGLANDLGAVLLDSAPPGVTPIPWNRASLDGRSGEVLRVFGYGSNDMTDAGMGVRREVELMINQVTPTHLFLGDGFSKGICHGDSGGPSLLTFNDGVERLAGVHSFTRTPDCLDGADFRIDAFRLQLADWLGAWEGACGSDGLCVSTCGATIDPDCVRPGDRCSDAIDCASRACITDPQHPEAYCSQSCASAACPAPLECSNSQCVLPQLPTARQGEACVMGQTHCLNDTRCDGVSPELALCSRSCTSNTTCAASEDCRPGFSGQFVCVPREIKLPIAVWSGRASGCSSGEDARNIFLVVAYVWSLRRARRRRNG